MDTRFVEGTEGRKSHTEWALNRWWEKVVYICGCVFAFLFAIGFLKGFFGAL